MAPRAGHKGVDNRDGRGARRGRALRYMLLACVLLLASVLSARTIIPAAAQDESTSRLVITDSDTSAFPLITLRAYGLAESGGPIALDAVPLLLVHDGEQVNTVEVGQSVPVGSLTIFLIDATAGTGEQLPAIEQAVQQFAASPYMREQVDTVALYRVTEEGAEQLLAPTGFYNEVRNFFLEPLEPVEGATALYDSIGGLLNEIDTLVPNPDMARSIVVFSDGTDAISTEFEGEALGDLAAERGVPIYTVWLENEDLNVGREVGRNFLSELARESRGGFTTLEEPEMLAPLYEQLSALGSQRLIHYRAPELAGGDIPVVLSLADEPAAQADTSVTINPSRPVVSLTIPPDSRTIRLPDLDEAVELAMSAAVAWLDDEERTVTEARLLVNGISVAEIPPTELERFAVTMDTLAFGDNRFSIVVVDEQGLEAFSPPLTVTVIEGEEEIPEALQPPGLVLPPLLPLCLGGVLLLALFGLGGVYVYRSGRLTVPQLGGRRRRRPTGGSEALKSEAAPSPAAGARSTRRAMPGEAPAYLETIATESQMPQYIPLEEGEIRLGRAPSLADVAFEQDATVSRLHATIIWDGHTYRIYDDDSTSGTWVNDQQVPDYGAQLFDGDEVFLGKVHLRFLQR
ncbi:MAG: FHA domain-containing protein [Candidatus Promineifilaceae bacterium]|nr:FHA domain-containing protein [Candidatus Promineifilaceae bacterium]